MNTYNNTRGKLISNSKIALFYKLGLTYYKDSTSKYNFYTYQTQILIADACLNKRNVCVLRFKVVFFLIFRRVSLF